MPAKPAHLVKLTHDSVILRLIEQGDIDRLVVGQRRPRGPRGGGQLASVPTAAEVTEAGRRAPSSAKPDKG